MVESMLMGRPVPEEDFVFNYQLPIVPKATNEDVETQFEDDLLAQYKTNAPPVLPRISDEKNENPDENQLPDPQDQEETSVEKFLLGKKLYLTGRQF